MLYSSKSKKWRRFKKLANKKGFILSGIPFFRHRVALGRDKTEKAKNQVLSRPAQKKPPSEESNGIKRLDMFVISHRDCFF